MHRKGLKGGGELDQYLRVPTMVFSSLEDIGELSTQDAVLVRVGETTLIDGMTLPSIDKDTALVPGRRMLVGGDRAGLVTMTVLSSDDVIGWGIGNAVLLQSDHGITLMVEDTAEEEVAAHV
jgi:hypothetical protein